MKDKIVKSVGRVFYILELFDRERRPLTGIEISRKLNYPHTSTLAILKSMEALDYLHYDLDTRAFVPSATMTQVVEWVITTLHDEVAILRVMKDLHAEIDETVNLSRHTGAYVKIVHGIESSKMLGIRVAQGVVMPLTSSQTGMVALATYTDDEVERIVRDLRRRNDPEFESVSVSKTLETVREIRTAKLSTGYDVYIKGIGIVCFALQSQTGSRPFVMGITGPTERMRENEAQIIKTAKRIINKHKVRLAYPL